MHLVTWENRGLVLGNDNWGKNESECLGNLKPKSWRVEFGEATLEAYKVPSETEKERQVERKPWLNHRDKKWVHLIRWPNSQLPSAFLLYLYLGPRLSNCVANINKSITYQVESPFISWYKCSVTKHNVKVFYPWHALYLTTIIPYLFIINFYLRDTVLLCNLRWPLIHWIVNFW